MMLLFNCVFIGSMLSFPGVLVLFILKDTSFWFLIVASRLAFVPCSQFLATKQGSPFTIFSDFKIVCWFFHLAELLNSPQRSPRNHWTHLIFTAISWVLTASFLKGKIIHVVSPPHFWNSPPPFTPPQKKTTHHHLDLFIYKVIFHFFTITVNDHQTTFCRAFDATNLRSNSQEINSPQWGHSAWWLFGSYHVGDHGSSTQVERVQKKKRVTVTFHEILLG